MPALAFQKGFTNSSGAGGENTSKRDLDVWKATVRIGLKPLK